MHFVEGFESDELALDGLADEDEAALPLDRPLGGGLAMALNLYYRDLAAPRGGRGASSIRWSYNE